MERGRARPLTHGRRGGSLWLWLPPVVFLAAFYFYPLASIVGLSFQRADGGLAALGPQALSTIVDTLGFTVWQAFLSTVLTLAIGLPGAYVFARYTFTGKRLLRALTAIPFVLPTLVVAAAFDALLGRRGIVNLGLMELSSAVHSALGPVWWLPRFTEPPIEFTHTFAAILVAHIFYNTTIVLRLVGDFWSHLDPDLGAAARSLGASPWQVARHVTAPLLAPAVAAAALLVFIFDFTSFGVILVLGGPRFATLEVEIYYQTVSLFNLPLAAVLAMLQLACTLVLTIIYTRLSARVARPVELRRSTDAQVPLKGIRARLSAYTLIGLLVLLLVAPLGALAVRSVTPVGTGRDAPIESGPTLRYYRALDDNPRQSVFFASPAKAIGVSLTYGAATIVLALLLGLPAAWSLAREPDSRVSRFFDPLLMLPLGTSAVTLGLGYLISLDEPPLDLRSSPVLVPLAHTLVAFPFVVRSLTPALRSVRPRLGQAASVLGASPRQVLLRVDLPLVGRALVVGAAFAFMISLGEFGATALISLPEYPTLPVAIYRFLGRPGDLFFGQAMAMSTILMAVTGGSMLAIERFRVAGVGEF